MDGERVEKCAEKERAPFLSLSAPSISLSYLDGRRHGQPAPVQPPHETGVEAQGGEGGGGRRESVRGRRQRAGRRHFVFGFSRCLWWRRCSFQARVCNLEGLTITPGGKEVEAGRGKGVLKGAPRRQ